MSLPAKINSSISLRNQIILKILNILGPKNEFRITITSPNYLEIKLFWGVVSYTRGEKIEFILRGTEAYVNKIVQLLGAS